jgi:diguanylate cyclase (GGDEF)-like protein/PAS domain S-box-containing protein
MTEQAVPIDFIPDALITADRAGVIQLVNERLTAMFGYQPQELVGQSIEILLPEWARGRHVQHREAFHLNPSIRAMGSKLDLLGRRKDGSEFPIDVMLSPLPGDGGAVLAVIRDDTAAKRIRDRLHQLAHSDPLTGLPNRPALYHALELCFGRDPEAVPEPMAIALFDLDGFNEINDALGHSFGDELLKGVADRWNVFVGQGPQIYRLGGDEFVLLIPNCGDPTVIATIVKAMLRELERAFEIAATVVFVSASAGIALAPADGADVETLIANVDVALHKAKASGRGTYAFFHNALRADVRARKELDTKLRQAYLNGELELYFQPQVRLSDGTVVGSEALLRWKQGDTIVGPRAFINHLASSPIAPAVGSWILRTACETAASWRGMALPVSRVSVNLFPMQFHSPSLSAELEEILVKTGLSPESLELEITENTALIYNEAALGTVRRLRELGVGIALDDFGTGYASLSLLTEMPLTRIKIEQSFIRGLLDDKKLAAIVRSLITMAHNVGLLVIAEGVETAEQATFLRNEGCDEAQGYLFARPLTASAFQSLLRQGRMLDGRQSFAERF